MITLLADLTPAAAVSLGVTGVALIALVLAFAPANLAYFDPRRADEVERALPLLNAIADRRYMARYQPRHAAPKGDR